MTMWPIDSIGSPILAMQVLQQLSTVNFGRWLISSLKSIYVLVISRE